MKVKNLSKKGMKKLLYAAAGCCCNTCTCTCSCCWGGDGGDGGDVTVNLEIN